MTSRLHCRQTTCTSHRPQPRAAHAPQESRLRHSMLAAQHAQHAAPAEVRPSPCPAQVRPGPEQTAADRPGQPPAVVPQESARQAAATACAGQAAAAAGCAAVLLLLLQGPDCSSHGWVLPLLRAAAAGLVCRVVLLLLKLPTGTHQLWPCAQHVPVRSGRSSRQEGWAERRGGSSQSETGGKRATAAGSGGLQTGLHMALVVWHPCRALLCALASTKHNTHLLFAAGGFPWLLLLLLLFLC